MAVTREQVLAVARLARLDLYAGHAPEEAEARVAALAGQMEDIVGYMDILNQVDTTGVEPMYSPMKEVAPPRKDEVRQTLSVGEVLENAPKRQGNFFAVPPVI